MSNKEDLLKKVIALKERAETDGERKAAEAAELLLIEKYGLAYEPTPTVNVYYFKYKNEHEKELLLQIVEKVINCRQYKYYKSRKNYKTFGFDLTIDEAAQVEVFFEYYRRLFEEESKLLLRAFFSKHNLYADDVSVKEPCEMSDDDLRALEMMQGLKDAEINKALPVGKGR